MLITLWLSCFYTAYSQALSTYYDENCIQEFMPKYFAANASNTLACAIMFQSGLGCVSTIEAKTQFLETFDHGNCSYLIYLLPKPHTVTKRRLIDWIESFPAQRASMPEVMQSVWSYHAEKLKGTKYSNLRKHALDSAEHYARHLYIKLDTSGMATKVYSGLSIFLLIILIYYK